MPTSFAETQLNKQRSQLIMSYYRGLKLFRDSFAEEDKRRITYHRVDYLIETYFRNVKDLSHQLFHSAERGGRVRLLQATFDLSFGIVFHLMLKFKETLRLAENYNIDRLGAIVKQLRASSKTNGSEIVLFDSLRDGYERDLASLDEELLRTRDTLDEIERVFSKIISVYAGNTTIMRTLFENHPFFLKIFPGAGVDHIFQDMYPECGPARAHMVLGFDFVRSGHMTLADRAFRRATHYKGADGEHEDVDLAAIYREEREKFVCAGDAGAIDDRRVAMIEDFEADRQIAESSFDRNRHTGIAPTTTATPTPAIRTESP
jgi:hypothetical protein